MARTPTIEAMNLALALAERHFREPTLAHVGFLLSGRAHLWPAYHGLSEREKNDYAALIRLRGAKLENEGAAMNAVFAEFAKRDGNPLAYGPLEELNDEAELAGYENPGSVRFTSRGGAERDELIRSCITFLRDNRRRGANWAAREHAEDGILTLRSHGQQRTYRIPESHLPDLANTQESPLRSAPPAPAVHVQAQALLALAHRLANAGDPNFSHYERVARSFLTRLRSPHDASDAPTQLVFHAGNTRLLIAPTGSGKNVVADLALLDMAAQGRTAALVVTHVDGVLKAVRRLERAAQLLGLPIEVGGLFSQTRLLRETAGALERDPDLEAEGAWSLERLAYACRLPAYEEPADPDSWEDGKEPCLSLQARKDGSEHSVRCPFYEGCPKFSEFRRANRAQVLVINHHALLSGRMPLVLDDDRPRMLEFVLSRAELVLVDEIDALQKSAIERGSGRVTLRRFDGPSDLQRARDDLDQAAGPGPITGDRGRPLDGLLRVSTETLDLVNKRVIDWKHIARNRSILWEGSLDGAIGKTLFPNDPADRERPSLIDELYDPDSQPSTHQRIARALKPFTHVDLAPDESLQREVVRLRESIKEDLPHLSDAQRRELADRLVVRGHARLIATFLDRARDRLAEAASVGSEPAARAREEFGRFNAWSVSPHGALGRTIAGFQLSHELDSIEAVTMSGDPHGDVVELGDLAARALAGTARAVVGLSASAYFPGSATNHVLAPIAYYVPDRPGRVTVRPAHVQAASISGTTGPDRLENVRDTVQKLWRDYLSVLLGSAREDDLDRARTLIVTGNYEEARAAAEALARTVGSEGDRLVRYVARGSATRDPMALPRQEIETFPSLDGARVLIAPRGIIARGYNIMAGGKSAIRSIFMLVRPIPPTADMNRSLAYVSYNTHVRSRSHTPKAEPVDARRTEQKIAGALFSQFRRANPAFSMLPNDIQHQVLADVFVDLLQIVGRARRGDTSVDVYFVDTAFHEKEDTRWDVLTQRTLDTWRRDGDLSLMRDVHRSLIEALEEYAQQAPAFATEEA